METKEEKAVSLENNKTCLLWHVRRANGVSASDVGIIMSFDVLRTRALYEAKRKTITIANMIEKGLFGDEMKEDAKGIEDIMDRHVILDPGKKKNNRFAMNRGKYLEYSVKSAYLYGQLVTPEERFKYAHDKGTLMTHPKHTWLKATPDLIWRDREHPENLLKLAEFKYPMGVPEAVEERYWWQMQTQLFTAQPSSGVCDFYAVRKPMPNWGDQTTYVLEARVTYHDPAWNHCLPLLRTWYNLMKETHEYELDPDDEEKSAWVASGAEKKWFTYLKSPIKLDEQTGEVSETLESFVVKHKGEWQKLSTELVNVPKAPPKEKRAAKSTTTTTKRKRKEEKDE